MVHHKQVETAKRQLVQERESLQVRHAELKETHQKKVGLIRLQLSVCRSLSSGGEGVSLGHSLDPGPSTNIQARRKLCNAVRRLLRVTRRKLRVTHR